MPQPRGPVALMPDLALSIEAAIAAHQSGATDTAEQLCLDILTFAPDRPRVLTILFEIRKAQGRPRAAEALIRRVVSIDPNNFWATNELVLLLIAKPDLGEAEIHARNGVRIAPDLPQAHNLMGIVFTEAQRPQAGEYHYRRVLELSGARDPILLANLAWNLKTQGRMEEARALYKESFALAPDIPLTLLGWARLEEADRDFAAAAAALDRLDVLWPGDPRARLARAVLLGRTRRHDEAIALLDETAARMDNGRLGGGELLEKGRLLDQLGRYDDAYAAFDAGKRDIRESSGVGYADAAANDLCARLRGFFTASRLTLLPRAATREDCAQPVFILGFPRSGTTLVEQTLSAHRLVSAGDELPLINDITGIMPRMLSSPLGYPEALAELWMGDKREGLDNLRDYYLQSVRQMGVVRPGTTWFTDKMPLNEMHLGLIALLFPKSPMLHVIRHPLDIMVSAMSNQFTHGFCCAYALETAALHYVRIRELVRHYRAEMRLNYLAIRYEDIVADQRKSVRRMLDFIGIPFDKNCLSFHENRRYARTASYAQVTEKLYDRSKYRYRNYIRHLGPAIEILRPAIEELGYEIETG
jgi:tetratricopeptide (TPR) repeat protein